MIRFNTGPVFHQYFIVIVANLTFFQFGLTVGWMSPGIVKLRDFNQMMLPQPLTEGETAWVISISSLAALAAFSYVGFILENLGRKYSILVAVLPRVVHCFLLLFASRVWMLYLGRAFCGLSDFSVISVVSMYSAEIASKEIRGGLGTVSQISSAIGSMILLSVGPFISYLTLNIIMTSLIVVTFIPLLFLPESPYFLFSRGKTNDAIEILTYLRGDVTLAQEELKEYASHSTTKKMSIKEFLLDKVTLKSLGMTIFLAVCAQMTGFNAVAFYLQIIFESTGTIVPPEISSVVIGFIQVFGCICTILLTDRFGRKPVLTSTLFIMAVGLVGLGTFFQIQEGGERITGFLNYLPLISMMVVIFSFNAGIGSLVWTLISELFDGPSRAIGVTSGTFASIVFTFLTIRYFSTIAEDLGASTVYWIFASCCLISCMFIGFVVPETKGKTFGEIQLQLGRK